MTDTIDSIQFSGEPAPLLDASSVESDDLLTAGELAQVTGASFDGADADQPVTLTTTDGSFYAVGDGEPDRLEVAGVVSADEANQTLGVSDE